MWGRLNSKHFIKSSNCFLALSFCHFFHTSYNCENILRDIFRMNKVNQLQCKSNLNFLQISSWSVFEALKLSINFFFSFSLSLHFQMSRCLQIPDSGSTDRVCSHVISKITRSRMNLKSSFEKSFYWWEFSSCFLKVWIFQARGGLSILTGNKYEQTS